MPDDLPTLQARVLGAAGYRPYDDENYETWWKRGDDDLRDSEARSLDTAFKLLDELDWDWDRDRMDEGEWCAWDRETGDKYVSIKISGNLQHDVWTLLDKCQQKARGG